MTQPKTEAKTDVSGNLEIDSTNGVECRDDENICIAKGDVRARKGNVTVTADIMTVHFTGTGKKRKISTIDAEATNTSKKARLQGPAGFVEGDKLHYDVITEQLDVTGKGLVLQTPKYRLTAKQRLRYNHTSHRGDAIGEAEFTHEDRKIRSDRLTAFFAQKSDTDPSNTRTQHSLSANPTQKETHKDGALGEKELALKTVEGHGHVYLSRPPQSAEGERGTYDAATDVAHLYGNVRIVDGKSFAKGGSGTVDIKKGRAYLRPSSEDGRAHILITPKDIREKRHEDKQWGRR